MKRLLDLSISLFLLLVLCPLFVVIAFAIKIDSKGPVFFRQERLGKDGKVFRVFKFRTMVNNAEGMGPGLFTHEGDERITRVGGFLRKTSLDELPQLFNVLKGEMSLVGPRPPVPYHPYKYEEYGDEQKLRFAVLPGITGYAQVKGRNEIEWDERIELDVEYVKKQSLLLDFKILLKTIIVVIARKSIYRDRGSSIWK